MLNTQGFLHFKKSAYKKADADFNLSLNSAALFFQSYENLELDQYMQDGGKYRLRRFGRFQYSADKQALLYIKGSEFFQSKEYNFLNGGSIRNFSPIETHITNNKFLLSLIKINLEKIQSIDFRSEWLINIHQIRIACQPGEVAMPAPEGMHKDGHRYVAQVLISKHNVNGGISKLYDNDKKEVASLLLRSPLDTILLNDNLLYHDVTPILPQDEQAASHRDMLLIDYNYL